MRNGFTLLEVMIAVAILGLSLTAIFSSEVGAANVAARARRQNTAATLARCKMGEVEELIAVEGLPLLDKKDTDRCCEHAPVDGYECDWIVERVILPELGGDELDDEDDEDATASSPTALINESVEEVENAGGTPEEVIAGQAGNLTSIALQIGYPILKPYFEEQVRRAKVTVRWKEGPRELGFDVIQYLVSEQIAQEEDGTVGGEGEDEEQQ